MLSDNPITLVFEGPSHEEGAAAMELAEPGQAQVGAIKAVDAVGNWVEVVTGNRQVVALAIGHHQESGEMAPVVQLAVELDGALLFAKPCPVEDTEAEIDGGGVKGKEGIFEAKLMVGGQGLSPAEDGIEKSFEDGAGAALQGIRQSGTGDRGKSQVVETRMMGQ